MWSDLSKRPLIVLGCVFLLAIAGGALWWWSSHAPQRHLEDIIEQAYDHAEMDGPDAFSHYRRRSDDCTLSGNQPADDEWRGYLGGQSRLDSIDDAGPAAVRLADSLEQAGWEVRRFIVPDGESDVSFRRVVQAERARDTIELVLGGVSVHMGASTGPCNSADQRDLDDPPRHYEMVDEFPS